MFRCHPYKAKHASMHRPNPSVLGKKVDPKGLMRAKIGQKEALTGRERARGLSAALLTSKSLLWLPCPAGVTLYLLLYVSHIYMYIYYV